MRQARGCPARLTRPSGTVMRLTLDTPFILLDDGRDDGVPARLYQSPVGIVRANSVEAVQGALKQLRAARASGHHVAGYVAYEAGAALLPHLPPPPGGTPLLWFALFEQVSRLPAASVPALLPDPRGVWIGEAVPGIAFADYAGALDKVLGLIAAGDIYQANLTFQAQVAVIGDPLAAYAALRARARAGFGAIVWTGEDLLLSLSPELFFSVDDRVVHARPMKGTAPRGADPAEDRTLSAALAADPKQRAENLMIVDLMRNDLSRIARPGSVAVPSLFEVETYPTLHQMVSRVTATLAEGRDAVDVLEALFPCGSITGAPKIRAMQVISEVEGKVPRGPYTGAIGHLEPGGDAMFNVAIRTLCVTPEQGNRTVNTAAIGLGSGIVADSRADAEWNECRTKARFLSQGQRAFDLIETMAFDPLEGLLRFDRHLARIRASADLFGFRFDRHTTRNELQAATFALRDKSRVRLLVARSGAIAIDSSPAPGAPDGPVDVRVVPLPVDATDFRLRHKTSDRDFYDRPRRASGTFDVVFIRPDGLLTEGSFTNIFIERGGMLLTPPLERGLLPGVLRAELIESGRAIEADLTPDDLAGGLLIGNALRGLMPARLVA